MEHVIASQLMGHLNTNNILYDLQHGFRDKRSCETQLLALVHELAHGVNANKQTDMAILDFSKDLNALQHWEDMWLMTFNAKKCNTMQVSSSPKPISFDYSIHNTVLENVPHTKYLGVTIQSNLK